MNCTLQRTSQPMWNSISCLLSYYAKFDSMKRSIEGKNSWKDNKIEEKLSLELLILLADVDSFLMK